MALYKSGMLDSFHTDIYVPQIISHISKNVSLPSSFKALLQRNNPELPFQYVDQQFLLGLEFRRRVRRAKSLKERQDLLAHYGAIFAKKVGASINGEKNLIAFTGAALESFLRVKDLGGKAILDQVDPGLLEWERIKNERDMYPGWEIGQDDPPWSYDFEDRVWRELELADEVIVNSQYSKKSLEFWGSKQSIKVVPIASSVQRMKKQNINIRRPLRVLFFGALCLRKGVHYALEAFQILKQKGVEIEMKMAGELYISTEKLRCYSGVTYLGTVASSEVPALFDNTDVMIFPTLSDGFGMVQVESMSRGVPVISSSFCAEIVSHNENGFVLDEVTAEGIAYFIERYSDDRKLLEVHSSAAFDASEKYSVQNYQGLIRELFD
ncbi:glycosyltransferase family 4 protein [Microbulbifer aestuariivivens]|uniref:glycosyltransferase family 4 protein n=1 Tax=Microbulbifer aestuariivivens TaxID=1908308 RepID=UPI0031E82E8C